MSKVILANYLSQKSWFAGTMLVFSMHQYIHIKQFFGSMIPCVWTLWCPGLESFFYLCFLYFNHSAYVQNIVNISVIICDQFSTFFSSEKFKGNTKILVKSGYCTIENMDQCSAVLASCKFACFSEHFNRHSLRCSVREASLLSIFYCALNKFENIVRMIAH